MKCMLAAALALLPMTAVAQVVEDCDWRARAVSIPEPWEDNIRSFANGEVRIALLDGIEPAAGAFYLLVLHPPRMELGERQCHIVALNNNGGYAALSFSELEAGYDPTRGLTLSLPGMLYLPEENFQNSLILHVTVNQTTGEVTAEHELGRE